MTKLSVNINKVATLRNTRALGIPSVVNLSRIALEAGAAGITIHPRPDRRHIRPDDVTELAALWKEFPTTEFNIEGNPFIDYMPHVRAVRPTQCTLVPDTTEAFTSDHGWALSEEERRRLRPLIDEMRVLGCRVSLFMDAETLAQGDGAAAAWELGAQRVELYTEPYAGAFARGGDVLEKSLDLYAAAARRAHEAGLAVNAGHDLNLHNLPVFLQRVPQVAEVSIGHALIADALELGMAETVRRYLAACAGGTS
jgi:pyridoxine 5-phosphate synthase